jgi:hypothetical protein
MTRQLAHLLFQVFHFFLRLLPTAEDVQITLQAMQGQLPATMIQARHIIPKPPTCQIFSGHDGKD